MNRLAAVLLMFLILSVNAVPQTGQSVTIAGRLYVIWSDQLEASARTGAEVRYVLIDAKGNKTDIRMDPELARPSGGIRRLHQQAVRVTGRWASSSAVGSSLVAESIQPDPAHRAAGQAEASTSALAGSQRWVNILCRFADLTSLTPNPVEFFSGLMGTSYPGLDHYWREVSFDSINLNGSTTVGWYNLPHNRSYYIYDKNGDGVPEADLDRLLHDATAVADADVYFPDFVGINLMFNNPLDCCAWGGTWPLDRDGQSRNYSVAWLPPWGFQNQCVLAHEMGHGFGLPHSSGPYGQVYDSPWDVMSNNWASNLYDSVYKTVGVHTISYHKDLLGWIAPARKLVVNPGSRRTVKIERLAEPGSSNYLMVQIPIADSPDQFYTAETRKFAGYDRGLPGEALIIHSVDTAREIPAQVVDADGNGNPGDGGSMWLPGETFVDSAHGISVAVKAVTPTTVTVAVNSGAVETPVLNDFDGDGLADISVLRPSTGIWYVLNSGAPGEYLTTQWGVPGDRIVSGDYDGDGKTNIAVWRPANGTWYILSSQTPGTYTASQWGIASDHPMPGDYDGDGIADIAVWRPETGVWYILPSNSPGSYIATQWGLQEDVPVTGDFDGDGKTDLAVWRPGTGVWYVLPSSSPDQFTSIQWGLENDIPVPGDYDGDGKTDIAVWRPDTGIWYLLPSATPGSYLSRQWGLENDIPVPAYYDSDRKMDIAVWRPETGIWYTLPSAAPGSFLATQWGVESDKPIPSAEK